MTRARAIQPVTLLAEAAAIVGSILLAFAIDAWWDDHKERQAETAALRTLSIEFTENLRQLASDRRILSDALTAVNALLKLMGPDQRGGHNVETVAPLLISCLTNATFEPRVGTLNSLIYSGRLNLIQDEALQAMLTEWPSAADDLTDWQRVERENTEQYMLRFTFDYVAFPDLMAALGAEPDVAALPPAISRKLTSAFAGSRFESDFDGLFAALPFEGQLTSRRVNLEMLIERIDAMAQSTETILARLARYE